MNFRTLYKSVAIIILLCGVANLAQAQNKNDAEEAFRIGNYFSAINQYELLLQSEPDNLDYHLSLGIAYLRTNIEPKSALPHLVKVEQSGNYPDYVLVELARAQMYHLDYDAAKKYLKKFEQRGGVTRKNEDDFYRMIANCDAALDLVKYPVDVEYRNLGAKLNSKYPDYHPFITKDGKTILYTTRRKIRPGSKPEFDGYYPSDIFESRFEEGNWTEGKKLGDRINTIYDEQTVGITQSGDSMFFYIDHVEEYGNIYVSTRKGKIYANPKKVENDVNSSSVESSCSISRDGNTIIFSSSRPGGFGGQDIWMIRKTAQGTWGQAENLGPEINSRFHEDFPSLSIDGKTLYFSSDGHPGLGGYDLYFSTWDDQSHIWTKPQNLGYPLNGPGNNKTISFSGKGDKAVVTAIMDDSYGDLDLYSVEYLKEIDDEPAVFLVNVPTNETNPEAIIEVRDEFDEIVGQYLPNRITERYLIALPLGKYFLYADAPGFAPYNEVMVVSEFHKRQLHNVKLIKMTKTE